MKKEKSKEAAVLTLYQPPRSWGLPNMSPFCVKLETYLRMAGIQYRLKPGSPQRAPKGKIPYVRVDEEWMGDSSLIIDRLERTAERPLDAHLSAEQRAQALAVKYLVEEHLYFAIAHLRWGTENSWRYVREFFLSLLPPLVGPVVMGRVRRSFLANIRAQGMGRHSREEVVAFAKADLEAVSTLLGEGPFFFGDRPSTLDATLYGFLIQVLWVPWDSPEKEFARGLPHLEAYCLGIRERYWKDLAG